MTLINLGQVKFKFNTNSYMLPDVHGFFTNFQLAFMPINYPNPNFADSEYVFTLFKDSNTGHIVIFSPTLNSYGYVYASNPYDGPQYANGICFYNYLQGGQYTQVDNHTLFQVKSLGGNKVSLVNNASGMYVGYIYDDWGSGGSGDLSHPVLAQSEDANLYTLTLEPVGSTNVEILIMRTAKSCSGANFENADFAGCELNNADFSGVTSIQNADFTNVFLQKSQFPGLNLGSAKAFAGADFTGSDLTSISGAQNGNFAGTKFNSCNLSNVDFSGANLTGASFISANLDGVNFSGCQLAGVSFDSCDLTKAKFDTQPKFSYSQNQAMTFANATLNFDLIQRNWSYFDLRGANIVGLPADQLSSKATPLTAPGCKLSGLKNDLQKVQLIHANLSNAVLTGLNLMKANLEGAILSSANLQGVVFTNANFTQANCTGALFMVPTEAPGSSQSNPAILTEAYLANTILDGAQLQGINMDNVQFFTNQLISGSASAKHASFVDTRMSGALLVNVDFSGANTRMNGASMKSSVLVGSKFQNADLSRSQSTNENPETSLVGADLRGTEFDNVGGGAAANMDGTDMDSAKYSTESGQYETTIKSNFDGSDVPVMCNYGKTILGETTDKTTCPNGEQGPCSI